MKMVEHDTIFTNVAMTPDGDVWWEGMGIDPSRRDFSTGRGSRGRKDSGKPAAHPNSRFTTPMRNNPALSPHADAPQGVPISAIIFGGRRASTVPLVLESFDWNHGVYLGATMGSETTAAATGKVGVVRRDPMAMLPFCGYNMGDYFAHWLEMQHKLKIPPKVFMVNWFRKDREGQFLWPGYGENMRVLKWIVERVNGRAAVEQSAVGMKPADGALDLTGIEIAPDALKEAMAVKPEDWSVELDSQEEFFKKIGASVPAQMDDQRKGLRAGLGIR